jgi:hypothetical protein
MLIIARDLFLETFSILRRCGAKRRECQVLWLSAPSADQITAVRHSKHHSTAASLEVDPTWFNDLWFTLIREGFSIRAQIHTHGGAAWHSETDDSYPIIGTPGFVSVVVPRFALLPPSLEQLYVTTIQSKGGWCESTPREVIRIV